MAMILSLIPLDRTAMMLSSDQSHGDYVIVESVTVVVVVDVLDDVDSCCWYRYRRHRFSSDSFILKRSFGLDYHVVIFFGVSTIRVGTLTK